MIAPNSKDPEAVESPVPGHDTNQPVDRDQNSFMRYRLPANGDNPVVETGRSTRSQDTEATPKSERARYLVDLVEFRMGFRDVLPPHPADLLANLVYQQWGARPDRLTLDLAWLGLWRHAATGAGTGFHPENQLFLDQDGKDIDPVAQLRSQFRSADWRNIFHSGESYQEHQDLLSTGDVRLYLYRNYAYKRQFDGASFLLGASDPVWWFAFGNIARNCMAFHAPRCDNSDIVLSYLADASILALEIFVGYRPVGQAWLVRGSLNDGTSVLLVDSIEVYPTDTALLPGIVNPLRKACTYISERMDSVLLLNLTVYTRSATDVVAQVIGQQGHRFTRHQPRPGAPLLEINRNPSLIHEFKKASPWSRAGEHLSELGIEGPRYYLDAWAGFVDESKNHGEILAVPW